MRAAWLLVFTLSCASGDECEQARDCPAVGGEPGVCLEHVERAERYCTTECTVPLQPYSDPCPAGRACASTGRVAEGGKAVDVCIERILACVERERCGNGLDDDCNGRTDEDPCDRITCFSDPMCGEIRTSTCVLRGETRECGAHVLPRNVGSRCETHDDCYNRHCAEGFCAPACGLDDVVCPDGFACVNTALGFNACLRRCLGSDICNPGGQTDGRCVGRRLCTDPQNSATCFAFADVCVR